LPNLVENLFHDVRNGTGLCFPIPKRLAKLVEICTKKLENFKYFLTFWSIKSQNMSNKITGYERGEQTLEFLNVYCVSAFGQGQFLDLRGKPYPKEVLA
jgi:hypothetical protein